MNLGYKIKKLRNERDLSLEKSAKHLSVAKSILWKYEKNQAIPSAEIIKRMQKKSRNVRHKKLGDFELDADLASENYIIKKIKKNYPEHSILTE